MESFSELNEARSSGGGLMTRRWVSMHVCSASETSLAGCIQCLIPRKALYPAPPSALRQPSGPLGIFSSSCFPAPVAVTVVLSVVELLAFFSRSSTPLQAADALLVRIFSISFFSRESRGTYPRRFSIRSCGASPRFRCRTLPGGDQDDCLVSRLPVRISWSNSLKAHRWPSGHPGMSSLACLLADACGVLGEMRVAGMRGAGRRTAQRRRRERCRRCVCRYVGAASSAETLCVVRVVGGRVRGETTDMFEHRAPSAWRSGYASSACRERAAGHGAATQTVLIESGRIGGVCGVMYRLLWMWQLFAWRWVGTSPTRLRREDAFLRARRNHEDLFPRRRVGRNLCSRNVVPDLLRQEIPVYSRNGYVER
ncbi:hypothetical protein R3P38DRAFT_1658692 [Favolaschia claudopus]|uniref:Uncharacterized protein n=1 Tax=Favolaschia claudopus TaxID=2862362 RepID=A0AAW0AFP3_9AGAR